MVHTIFYTHQNSGVCAGVCVHAFAHIKWRRLKYGTVQGKKQMNGNLQHSFGQ